MLLCKTRGAPRFAGTPPAAQATVHSGLRGTVSQGGAARSNHPGKCLPGDMCPAAPLRVAASLRSRPRGGHHGLDVGEPC